MKIVTPWQIVPMGGRTGRAPKYVSEAQTYYMHPHDIRVIDGAPVGAPDCVIWLRSDCDVCRRIAADILSHLDTELIEP